MKIEFSDHAKAQLSNRPRIETEMVLETINRPDAVRVSYRQRSLFRKRFGQETLEVVTIKEGDTIIVVTEYILDENP